MTQARNTREEAISRPVGVVLDSAFERHDTGAGHPERPARLTAIREGLRRSGLQERCMPVEPRAAAEAEVLACHSPEYVERLSRQCAEGAPFVDEPECTICPASYDLALLAAGAALAAVDGVMAGRLRSAFCAVRPPGHHCERDRAMGFCLLNNVAIAARFLLDHHRLSRVAIVDWDVHHGNGTQHAFEDTAEVFFCSLHEHPAYLYPGTGFTVERGRGRGEGATLNIPFRPGAGDDDYRAAFARQVLPALDDYRPEFVLISAGFDAHRRDPLAHLNLESSSYVWMTQALTDLARKHAAGRLVSVLEGGYDLEALAESVVGHVGALLEADGK